MFHLLQPILYENFLSKKKYYPGIYIFSDIELLSDAEKQQSIQICETLNHLEHTIILNHPQKALKRYDLLKLLYQSKINTFQVFHLDENLTNVHYPAFLRIANDHQGSRSQLIQNKDELKNQIKKIQQNNECLDDWILTEFCDTSDDNNIFRKYSAFRVNDIIVPRHEFFSKEWCLKLYDLDTDELIKEEYQYISQNPHQKQLMSIFKKANIEYGRIDYGILNNKIHVWEINTNPTIITHYTNVHSNRGQTHQLFHILFKNAWFRLHQSYTGPEKNFPYEKIRALSHIIYEKCIEPDFVRIIYRVLKLKKFKIFFDKKSGRKRAKF